MAAMSKKGTPHARQVGRKKPNPRIVVLCEGEKTEVGYFKQFRKAGYTVKVTAGNGTDCVSLIKEIVKIRVQDRKAKSLQKDDTYWLVFDQDNNIPTQLNETKQLANKENIQLIYSNPCFELWYLLHFDYTTAQFRNADEVINNLNRHLKQPYQKNRCMFKELEQRCETAIQNAEKLKAFQEKTHSGGALVSKNCNPYTSVHHLIGLTQEAR
jgi:hypothetical protein